MGDYSISGYNEGTFKCRCGSEDSRVVYQGNFKFPKVRQKKHLPYHDDWFVKQFKEKIDRLRCSK